MLQLPTSEGRQLVRRRPGRRRLLREARPARRQAGPRRPLRGARATASSSIPAVSRASRSTCRARRRPSSPRPSRRRTGSAHLAVSPGHVGRTTAQPPRRWGSRALVGELRDVLRRRPEPDPQRRARRAPRRRQADRARRDLLVQPDDRRAHGGEGLPRGARDHQRRAPDRPRRRRLPGLDDGLQRRLRGRSADHGADEPRALHLPLPARARRDRRLPRHRPEVRQRHRPLAAPAHVRRLRRRSS